MPCTAPLDAWPAPPGAVDRTPVFSPLKSYEGARPFRVPCGKCASCRTSRAREWSIRIGHEASMHEANCFITPTYSDACLPSDRSLSLRDFQLFMKRLRSVVGPVRFFAVGEYGTATGRPHYHAIIFGFDPPDKVPWRKTGAGKVVDRSEMLQGIWGLGDCLIGQVTPQSAKYVAQYCLKKLVVDGDEAYRRGTVDPETGELREWRVLPEFAVMSRRPGIGATWYDRFKVDCFPSDFVVVEGSKLPVPRYYFNKLSDPERLPISARRKANARLLLEEQSERRLMTKHELGGIRAKRAEEFRSAGL